MSVQVKFKLKLLTDESKIVEATVTLPYDKVIECLKLPSESANGFLIYDVEKIETKNDEDRTVNSVNKNYLHRKYFLEQLYSREEVTKKINNIAANMRNIVTKKHGGGVVITVTFTSEENIMAFKKEVERLSTNHLKERTYVSNNVVTTTRGGGKAKTKKCVEECRKCITKLNKCCVNCKNKKAMKECVKRCKCCALMCKFMIEMCKCDPDGEMCKKLAKLCCMCLKKCITECNKHKDNKSCKDCAAACKKCHTCCMKCC